MLAPNIVILFDGNHADIPTGFVRDTSFDGRFPKGADANPGTTGGSATHTHTSSNNHTHNVGAHTHTGVTSQFNSNGDVTGAATGNWNYHSHGITSGELAATYTSAAANPAWSEVDHTPPNYRFIAIKSSGYNMIPVNGCVLGRTDFPGLTLHSASNGKNIAIAATGANAGDGGGATNHSHTFTHNHGNISHNHGSANTDAGSGGQSSSSGYATNHASVGHVHSTSFTAANTLTADNSTSYNFTGIEVKNYGVKILKNETASGVLVKPGMIAMTTQATNPIGWVNCDGTNDTPDLNDDYYVKNTTVNATAGSNTHTHSQAHVHAGGAHTHPYSTATNDDGGLSGAGPDNGSYRWTQNHNHGTGNTNSGGAVDTTSGTINADSASNEPPYIKVRFIQATNSALGGSEGAFLFHLIDSMNMPNLPVEA